MCPARSPARENGASFSNDRCVRAPLYNTTTERPRDRGVRASLSVASLGRMPGPYHEVVEKAGREVFRCSLSGRASGRWLEIPGWMFDRAARATWRVGAAPHVDIAVLSALATLLQDVTSVSSASSQLRDSSAALGSHDANRGDVHAPAYRSPPSSQQCTSVRSVLRPAHRRGADAAMAGLARRHAPYPDITDRS